MVIGSVQLNYWTFLDRYARNLARKLDPFDRKSSQKFMCTGQYGKYPQPTRRDFQHLEVCETVGRTIQQHHQTNCHDSSFKFLTFLSRLQFCKPPPMGIFIFFGHAITSSKINALNAPRSQGHAFSNATMCFSFQHDRSIKAQILYSIVQQC
jgi:hypothetical protein